MNEKQTTYNLHNDSKLPAQSIRSLDLHDYFRRGYQRDSSHEPPCMGRTKLDYQLTTTVPKVLTLSDTLIIPYKDAT